MISVYSFEFNSFAENTYVVYDETKAALIIDPGCYEQEECNQLQEYIESQQLEVKYILNTHCHIDHVLGNAFVKNKYRAPLLIHPDDEPTLRAVKTYAPSYGFIHYQEILPDKFIHEGDTIQWGNSMLKILFLPGHAPGHVGFFHADQKIVLGGDVLFQGSIGRTDLPGGDSATLIKSIHEKLLTLPNEVIVYPGHGSETTIGIEKATNPFCKTTV